MSKQTGAYDSLIKGVSEQVAHQRFPGQHWDQLNMVSDPVRGLGRRQGSVMMDEMLLPSTVYTQASQDDASTFGEQSLYLGVTEYSLMYRKAQVPVGSTVPALVALNKSDGTLLPVVYDPTDTEMAAIRDRGFNGCAAVGKLILLAAAGKNASYTSSDEVSSGPFANSCVAWVKGGNYSRTYTLSVKNSTTNVVTTHQYTTPTSYYPGVLDTSDIPAESPPGTPNPQYQKLVNDRVYAYQKNVNQWIGSAAAAIQPAAIAASLLALVAPALTGNVGLVGSTICMSTCATVACDDGGDGSTFVGVGRVVKQASDLSTVHVVGKVVMIKPQAGSNKVYYVKAVAKNEGNTGFVQVTWEECPGILITPTFVTALGSVQGGVLYVASSPTILATLASISVPPWAPSSSGDLDSQSLPAFLDREITYLRMYQDRLVIVSGATVFMSRPGDYFNFFKVTALSVSDNDPIEVYALGSEDDVITSGTLLDRNLILFGKQWQYAVPGRDSITPQSAFVAVQSGYRDSNDCPPETSGDLIFFTQQRQNKLTVQQMQTGAYADTLTASEISQQLNKFLVGKPQQIVAVTSPSALFIRTDAERHGFWVYGYLDAASGGERLFDAWGKWEFAERLGVIVGMTTKDGDLLVTTLRNIVTATAPGVYLTTDRFTLSTNVGGPLLDSQRPWLAQGAWQGSTLFDLDIAGAYTEAASQYWMLGDLYGPRLTSLRTQIGSEQDVNLRLGTLFDSYVVLTNPYMRDKDGKAILDGRLTLGNFNITLFESAAMDASICDLVDANSTMYVQVLRWMARAANGWILNTQQIADTASVVVGVYKEIRDCKVKLSGRSWLPLTISAIEWQGQFFTRRRG